MGRIRTAGLPPEAETCRMARPGPKRVPEDTVRRSAKPGFTQAPLRFLAGN